MDTSGARSTPFVRKQLVTEALQKFSGADRAVAAYDMLMAKDPGYLRALDLSSPTDVAKDVCKKLRVLHIPWTKAFFAKQQKELEEDVPLAELDAVAELDQADWDVPVTPQPTEEDSVSLVTIESLATWLRRETFAARSAIIVIGQYQCNLAEHIQVPLLWTKPGSTQAIKTFKQCTIVQLGTDSKVECRCQAQKVNIAGISNSCSFVTMKIFENHTNGSFSELFQSQFEDLSIFRQKGPAVSAKFATKRSTVKNDKATLLNRQLAENLTSILGTLVQEIELLSPVKQLQRFSSEKGGRSLGCSVAVDQETIAHTLYPFSGSQGITFQKTFAASDNGRHAEDDALTVLWAKDTSLTLPQVLAKVQNYNCHAGCICDMRRGIVGLRVPLEVPELAALRKLITGSEVVLGNLRYRLSNVPPTIGTKSQIQQILQTVHWAGAETQFVQYDAKAKACFAVVRAEAEPPTWNIDIGDTVIQICLMDEDKKKQATKVMLKCSPTALAPLAPVDIPAGKDADFGSTAADDEMLEVDAKSKPIKILPLPTKETVVSFQAPDVPKHSSVTAKQWASAIRPLTEPATACRPVATPISKAPSCNLPLGPSSSASGDDPRFALLQSQIDQLKGGMSTVENNVVDLTTKVTEGQQQQQGMATSINNMEHLLAGIAAQLSGQGAPRQQPLPPVKAADDSQAMEEEAPHDPRKAQRRAEPYPSAPAASQPTLVINLEK